jgi:ribose transport system permease protein
MNTPTAVGLDAQAQPASVTGALGQRLGGATQIILAFASLIALIVIFSVLKPDAFMTTDNMIGILQATNVIGVMAVACTFVIITGGIDLSVGVLMTFTAVMAGVYMSKWGWPMAVGVPATIASGALVGTISGLIITRLKITPFIATLGMMMLLKGASLLITEAKPIYFSDVEGFDLISLGSLVEKVLPFLPIPNGALIFLVVTVLSAFLLKKTMLGRYTFALGSNEEAVRLSGVNTNRWKVIIYTLSGGICSISGLLVASRLNSAQPALGQGYELDAIAAVVIGGTSLAGGTGTILGTVIGAFIMSVLINGLRIMSVAQEWQMVLTGLIIIVAVYTDSLRHKKA